MAMSFSRPAQTFSPSYRKRPSKESVARHWYHMSAVGPNGLREAFISKSVVRNLVEFSRLAWQRQQTETIGWLLGRVFSDDDGPYIYVEKAIEAPHAERSRAFVRTTPEDASFLAEMTSLELVNLEKLGWWHSHPNLGLDRYSGTDRSNQEMWCPLDYQIGLLVALDQQRAVIRGYVGPTGHEIEEALPINTGAPASGRRVAPNPRESNSASRNEQTRVAQPPSGPSLPASDSDRRPDRVRDEESSDDQEDSEDHGRAAGSRNRIRDGYNLSDGSSRIMKVLTGYVLEFLVAVVVVAVVIIVFLVGIFVYDRWSSYHS